MSKTPSTMIPLGTKAPDFDLEDTITNTQIKLSDFVNKNGLVVMFISNHCPFVVHILSRLVEVVKDYQAQGIDFVAICANDINRYPQDGPSYMKQLALKEHFTFPYLYDETQNVAKAYQAACTPDFFVFDHALRCVYRGRFDDATPGNLKPVTGNDLSKALDALLAGKEIPQDQKPSIGCNIKWK